MRFNISNWKTSSLIIKLSVWLLWRKHVVCQFYSAPGYIPRAYGPRGGPSPFDYYHPKSHRSPLPPVNFILPIPPKSMKGLYGPSLYPKDNIFANGIPTIRSLNRSVLHQDDTRFSSSALHPVQSLQDTACTSASGDIGTCLGAKDCQVNNGINSGNCADNFGVCCVFMASCGTTIRANGTYFVNNGYPTGWNSSQSCQVIIDKSSPEVCQYRLDFEQFILAGPEPINHICNYDQFIVTGSNPVPIICGLNSGNHIYVEAGPGASGPIVLLITTSGPEFIRRWKIRVTQISCPSLIKAEEGCLQYFTGKTGQIMSFNYEPTMGLHLSNQDYSICVRAERNFCSIQYSQCSANNRSRSFALTGNTLLGQDKVPSTIGATACNADWLLIPCAENVDPYEFTSAGANCVDRICGGTFSAQETTNPSVISTNVKPYRMYFHTNAIESPDFGNNGFCIRYVQQPCNNKT